MKKLWDKMSKKVQRMDSTKPLMENNNDYDGPEPEIGLLSQELRSVCSDDASDSHAERSGDRCTQRSERLSFPEPPADLGKHLDQHLEAVDEIVQNNHATTGADFLCQIRDHVDALLRDISTTKSWAILTNWVSQRKDQLDHSDLGLLDEWESKAEDKLLEIVKVEVRDSLGKILDADRTQMDYSEETYAQLYVDVIQCVNAMPKLVQEKQLLSTEVKKVCFQELQSFVERYVSEQDEVLRKKAEARRENPETIWVFLKTLKTCKELRQHIQAEGSAKAGSVDETKKTLEKLEALTLELIKEIAAELAESCLMDYFRPASRPCGSFSLRQRGERHCELFDSLRKRFPKLPYASDEQTIVMNEVYKVVAHSYLKHLLQKSQRKLKKQWSSDVGKAVKEDAEELHDTISDLAPGVQQWNRLLLVSQEVSDSRDLDSLKLTIALKQEDIEKQSEDLELIPKLLQWKGLSKRHVGEVLDALPGSLPKTKSKPLFLCRCCCCS